MPEKQLPRGMRISGAEAARFIDSPTRLSQFRATVARL
jgi:hypothetical protein